MSNNSICLRDRSLSGAIPPAKSGSGINGNEGVLCIPQSFSITGVLPSDCLLSHPGHSWVAYSSADMQFMSSSVTTGCVVCFFVLKSISEGRTDS